ncbi:hypothetical protein JCM10207_000698 [Rhodosporidiobolus poonsookiae]
MTLGQGAAGHRMADKLRSAAEAGVEGIEVFYPCLEAFAKEQDGETERDRLRAAARETARIAKDLGLDLFVLQPFPNYDGTLDPKEHAERIEEIKFRFELCKLLNCTMLQVPANYRLDAGVTGDEEKVVADLRELADLGLQQDPPIRFAYEAMCWSTYNYTWQHSWNIAQKVDRPNFGLCVDAFHISGYVYANPTHLSGIRIGGSTRLALSMNELVATIPKDKVFYLQLADAELIDPPLSNVGAAVPSKSPYHVEGQQPRMSWSRNCRLFPGERERGGYLPVEHCFKAFLEAGYEGYLSLEIFHRDLLKKDPSIPSEMAQRAKQSWQRLKEQFAL